MEPTVSNQEFLDAMGRAADMDSARIDKALIALEVIDDPTPSLLVAHHVMRRVQKTRGYETRNVALAFNRPVAVGDMGQLGPDGEVRKTYYTATELAALAPLTPEADETEDGFLARVRALFNEWRNHPGAEVVEAADPGPVSVHVDATDWKPRFSKAVDEARFTLGPMYVPDFTDAHGEWTDAAELQQAAWDYVRTGDRRIRLQHDVDTVAGEWVELMTWPYPVTVPMLDADGTPTPVEFPPNTVFLGVVWEPWAWALVKAGKLRGYSIGGMAQRVEVDLSVEGMPA